VRSSGLSNLLLSAAAALLATGASVSIGHAAPIEGTWQAPEQAEITVAPCGSAYCGQLSWIVIPREHTSECQADKTKFQSEMLDYQNPNPSMRARSLIGLEMMTLTPTSDPNRYDVHIYSSEDGKSYNGAAVVAGNMLNLQQCMGAGMCMTVQSWPRLPTRAGTPGFTCG
jgi:uncharacterized protein (DUF2147 family)